ncbi:MAG: response regulator [Terriglobales bacterium]|jgi:twitching motility two-component system response regulator PilH
MATILVVEDSRFIRTTIKQVLVEAGFGVVDVSDGEEALRLARNGRPHLIILDMLLPKMGGELVLRFLKHDPTTASIPVIVVSSLPQSNADKLKNEGAIAYIEKSELDLMTGGENLLRLVNAVLRTSKPQGPEPQR